MKNIITRTFVIFLVALAASGCIKETFPKGSTITSNQIEQSPNGLQYKLNGIPSAMTASGTAGYLSQYNYHVDFGIAGIHLMTDSMLEDLTVSGDLGYWQFGAFTQNVAMGADYIYCAYFWDCYYTWIKLANDIIAMAGEITEDTDETTKSIVGQAYAYRAMYYLDLARLYEPKQNKYAPVPAEVLGLTVPIIDETADESTAKNNPRATREDLYDFIFADLAKAEEYLANAGNSYNQPTVGAIKGMYARAWLELGAADDKVNATAYAKAAKYAKEAIDVSGKTPLTSAQWHDPKSGFNDGSANNSWIWGLSLSVENASSIITYTSHIASENTWGYATYTLPSISKALYEMIDMNDFRKKSWLDPEYTWKPSADAYNPNHGYQFAGTDDPISGYEKDYNIYNANEFFLATTVPYATIKFRPAGGECVEYTEGNCADHPLMRVEEMYFIEMEATLYDKKGGLDAAKKLLNEFMQTYRYSSYDCSWVVSEEDFIKEMLLQKRIEFWGEGILMYDYKRLNQGITRGYTDTNFPAVATFNTEGRSPQWNIVITRGEFQSNTAINQDNNNPDPTSLLKPWTE